MFQWKIKIHWICLAFDSKRSYLPQVNLIFLNQHFTITYKLLPDSSFQSKTPWNMIQFYPLIKVDTIFHRKFHIIISKLMSTIYHIYNNTTFTIQNVQFFLYIKLNYTPSLHIFLMQVVFSFYTKYCLTSTLLCKCYTHTRSGWPKDTFYYTDNDDNNFKNYPIVNREFKFYNSFLSFFRIFVEITFNSLSIKYIKVIHMYRMFVGGNNKRQVPNSVLILESEIRKNH